LLPENRYAGMTNVWFIPSIAALKKWMLRCGFVDVNVLDVSETTTEEQRKTSWVDSYSLDHFLENNSDNNNASLDNSKPIRVILTAKKTLKILYHADHFSHFNSKTVMDR
jgi:Protein of unknown function (DUF1698).